MAPISISKPLLGSRFPQQHNYLHSFHTPCWPTLTVVPVGTPKCLRGQRLTVVPVVPSVLLFLPYLNLSSPGLLFLPPASLSCPTLSFWPGAHLVLRLWLLVPSIAPLSSPPLSAPPMPYSAGQVQSATFSALDSSRSLWLTMKAPHCQFIQEGDGFFTPTSGRSQLCQDIGTPITGFFQTIREQTCAIMRHEVYAGLLLSG